MKTFKNILSEVAQPKSSEEKAFKDQHNAVIKPHPVALPHQHTGDIGKPKAARPADQEDDSQYDAAYGDKPNQEPTLRPGRKFSQFRANESKEMSNMKALDKASETTPEGKKKVSLAKAPWEKDKKNEEAEINELDLDEGLMDKIKNKATDIRRKTLGPNAAEKDAAEKARKDQHWARMKRQHDSSMAKLDRIRAAKEDKKNEEAEINELDKKTLGSYIKKAHSDKEKQDAKDKYHQAKGDTMDRDDDMYHQWGKANKAAKKSKNRTAGIAKAADRLVGENTDLSDKISDIAFGKWNEALSGGQKKLDHNKNGKIDGHDFAIMRAKGKKKTEVDETTSSAMKHGVTQTGPDGKTRTVFKKTRTDRTDDRGQDVIGEAVKVGNMRLKNGKNVKVSKQDAKLLNDFYKNLNAKNRRDMSKVMMKDNAGFEEIVGFAREAL